MALGGEFGGQVALGSQLGGQFRGQVALGRPTRGSEGRLGAAVGSNLAVVGSNLAVVRVPPGRVKSLQPFESRELRDILAEHYVGLPY